MGEQMNYVKGFEEALQKMHQEEVVAGDTVTAANTLVTLSASHQHHHSLPDHPHPPPPLHSWQRSSCLCPSPTPFPTLPTRFQDQTAEPRAPMTVTPTRSLMVRESRSKMSLTMAPSVMMMTLPP